MWNRLFFQDRSRYVLDYLVIFHDRRISILTLILVLVGSLIVNLLINKLINLNLLQEHLIELIWTIIPAVILLFIAVPSLQILYLLDDPFLPSLTIKIIGHQWYWSYEYSDFVNLEYDSYLINESLFRLLEVDNSLIFPKNIKMRLIIGRTDVIHSWTVPALGLKIDAVPGRLNQLLSIVSRSGLYFGQCSEICGVNHRFIPIKLEVIPIEYFSNWLNLN